MNEPKTIRKVIKQCRNNIKQYIKSKSVADNDSELLQVLTEDGKPTGRFEKREIVHRNRLFHNEVALWIIDKENNSLNNLELRCPNCHYFTDTYKSKNRKTEH